MVTTLGHSIPRSIHRSLDVYDVSRLAAFWEVDEDWGEDLEFLLRDSINGYQDGLEEIFKDDASGSVSYAVNEISKYLVDRARQLRDEYHAERPARVRTPRQVVRLEMREMLSAEWADAEGKPALSPEEAEGPVWSASRGTGLYSGEYLLDLLHEAVQIPCSQGSTKWLLESVAETVVEIWKVGGGRELPEEISYAISNIAITLAFHTDINAGEWDFVDNKGLPERPSRNQLATTLLNGVMEWVRKQVTGELKFDSSGWATITVTSFLDQVAAHHLTKIQQHRTGEGEVTEIAIQLAEWQKNFPAPAPQPYGISPLGAERWVCDWMIHMGASDAEVTRAVSDGGIDVVSRRWVAQVKLYSSAVGIGDIRQLVGAAAVLSGSPRTLFFSSGGYPAQAPAFADSVGMALFAFNPETGSVTAHNMHAEHVLVAGLLSH